MYVPTLFDRFYAYGEAVIVICIDIGSLLWVGISHALDCTTSAT
jgi:hypothetical protein